MSKRSRDIRKARQQKQKQRLSPEAHERALRKLDELRQRGREAR